jgi:hypothetical protein
MASQRTKIFTPVNTSLLNEADISRLNKEAEKKIQEERKKDISEKYLAQQTELERAKYEPNHILVEMVIDLPAYTKNMLIDGVYYNHGDIVSVPKHMADSIRDNMARAWLVERQAGNPNLRDYIPVKESTVSALSTGRV